MSAFGSSDVSLCLLVVSPGTYTPLCLLTKLPDNVGKPLLRFVWTMAALGVVQSLVWTRSPKAVNALLYVLLGWAVVPYWGPVSIALQPLGQELLVAGGVTFTLGAVVFATKFPDPVPHVFGYHEVGEPGTASSGRLGVAGGVLQQAMCCSLLTRGQSAAQTIYLHMCLI